MLGHIISFTTSYESLVLNCVFVWQLIRDAVSFSPSLFTLFHVTLASQCVSSNPV